MNIELHQGDLPDHLTLGEVVAVDTETMGLKPERDRLCVVQLSDGDGTAHLVQLQPGGYRTPNLNALLADPDRLKLFHYARFDLAMLRRFLGVACGPVYCTKIASRLARTYTDRHGLKDLVRELLGVELDKTEQSSDWGAPALSETQLRYAARDVAHLHATPRPPRCDAGARGPQPSRGRLLRLPAGPGRARPCRLGRAGPVRALSPCMTLPTPPRSLVDGRVAPPDTPPPCRAAIGTSQGWRQARPDGPRAGWEAT